MNAFVIALLLIPPSHNIVLHSVTSLWASFFIFSILFTSYISLVQLGMDLMIVVEITTNQTHKHTPARARFSWLIWPAARTPTNRTLSASDCARLLSSTRYALIYFHHILPSSWVSFFLKACDSCACYSCIKQNHFSIFIFPLDSFRFKSAFPSHSSRSHFFPLFFFTSRCRTWPPCSMPSCARPRTFRIATRSSPSSSRTRSQAKHVCSCCCTPARWRPRPKRRCDRWISAKRCARPRLVCCSNRWCLDSFSYSFKCRIW